MSEILIDDLPTDSSVGGAENIPLSDSGTTKKVTTAALKDYALAQLQAVGTVSSMTGNDLIVNTSSGLKRISWADFDALLDAAFVNLAGDQTISGDKTFSGEVVVAAPTENMNPATKQYVDTGLAGKVAAVTGKGLSTEDFTSALKTKLEALATNANTVHYTADSDVTDEMKAQARTNIGAASATDVTGKAAQNPTFTQASTLTVPTGYDEPCETLWGKVWKCISSLISHLADTTSHVTASERTSWNAKSAVLTFDETPTDLSDNPVKSKGIKTALDAKQDTLTFDSSPTFGSSNPVTSGGVHTALDAKMDTISGGTTGQIIRKSSSGNAEWSDESDGLPSGGTTGQVVRKTSSGAEWSDETSEIPAGGAVGQIMRRTSDGIEWDDETVELPASGAVGTVLKKTASGVAWQTDETGIPSGGSVGNVIKKTSDGVEWASLSLSDVLSAGSDGQVLKTVGTAISWAAEKTELPVAGSEDVGKFLCKTSDSVAWADASSAPIIVLSAELTGNNSLITKTIAMSDKARIVYENIDNNGGYLTELRYKFDYATLSTYTLENALQECTLIIKPKVNEGLAYYITFAATSGKYIDFIIRGDDVDFTNKRIAVVDDKIYRVKNSDGQIEQISAASGVYYAIDVKLIRPTGEESSSNPTRAFIDVKKYVV